MAEPDSKKQSKPGRPIGPFGLWLLAVVVGIVSGLGAAAFRGLIALFHNLFFLGKLSIFYDANAHTAASPWGAWIILAPIVGALGVAFLVKTFAPEAKGHGVPEVMDAIYYNKGIIRPVVAVIKALASGLSIGTGGSVGREGPIIQIASAFGSTIGQWLRIPAWQRVTLIAAGAGGGIAATFNTPIGGILFAAEIMLHEVSVWTLVPVAISTATATYVGRLFFGANPSFVIPAFEESYYHATTNPIVLLSYVGLAAVVGCAAALFIRSIYAFEDFFEQKIRGGYYVRHVLGMSLVGVMMYLLMQRWGHYYVQGIGYSTVQDILSGVLAASLPLALLFVLKLVATSLTLGSGGSGGIFSPSLYLGATLGATYGTVLGKLFPALPISPPAFAVAGMAGMVGGATGAAITAIVMIFEMTRDYGVIVPMTITVAISYGVRKVLLKESIYTLKLARRGHYMPEALQTNFQHMRLARDLKNESLALVPVDTTLDQLREKLAEPGATPLFLVEDQGQIRGVLTEEMAYRAMRRQPQAATAGEVASTNYDIISENTTLFEIVTRMHVNRTDIFLVSANLALRSAKEILGWISKDRIASSMAEGIGLFVE
jgi:CIC family chloride channel protein